jgi:predicted DNA-binding protein
MRRLDLTLAPELVVALDRTAARFELPRAELIRRAVEQLLDDVEDVALAQERLADLADPVLSWRDVRGELLGD